MRTVGTLSGKDLAKIAEMLSYAGQGYQKLRQRVEKIRKALEADNDWVELITEDAAADREDDDLPTLEDIHKMGLKIPNGVSVEDFVDSIREED